MIEFGRAIGVRLMSMMCNSLRNAALPVSMKLLLEPWQPGLQQALDLQSKRAPSCVDALSRSHSTSAQQAARTHDLSAQLWTAVHRSPQYAPCMQVSEESIKLQLDIYRGETLGVGPIAAFAPGKQSTWSEAVHIPSLESAIVKAHMIA